MLMILRLQLNFCLKVETHSLDTSHSVICLSVSFSALPIRTKSTKLFSNHSGKTSAVVDKNLIELAFRDYMYKS